MEEERQTHVTVGLNRARKWIGYLPRPSCIKDSFIPRHLPVVLRLPVCRLREFADIDGAMKSREDHFDKVTRLGGIDRIDADDFHMLNGHECIS